MLIIFGAHITGCKLSSSEKSIISCIIIRIYDKPLTSIDTKAEDNSSIEQINLDKKDYVEANIEAVVIEEDVNWLKVIKNTILEKF